MNITGRVKRFVLFTAANGSARKDYVRSFGTLEQAVAEASKLKTSLVMRWQVIDNTTSKIVAEDVGVAVAPLAVAPERLQPAEGEFCSR